MIRRLNYFIAFVSLCLSMAFAQTETGQITGTVMDQTGAAIPTATVTVRGLATGVVRTATTGDTGIYNVTNLLPGEYTVTASASPRFAPSM